MSTPVVATQQADGTWTVTGVLESTLALLDEAAHIFSQGGCLLEDRGTRRVPTTQSADALGPFLEKEYARLQVDPGRLLMPYFEHKAPLGHDAVAGSA